MTVTSSGAVIDCCVRVDARLPVRRRAENQVFYNPRTVWTYLLPTLEQPPYDHDYPAISFPCDRVHRQGDLGPLLHPSQTQHLRHRWYWLKSQWKPSGGQTGIILAALQRPHSEIGQVLRRRACCNYAARCRHHICARQRNPTLPHRIGSSCVPGSLSHAAFAKNLQDASASACTAIEHAGSMPICITYMQMLRSRRSCAATARRRYQRSRELCTP